jgi:hypothetical protein
MLYVWLAQNNTANFRIVERCKFTINGHELAIVDVGPPTPANLLTVTINHLPALNDKKAMGLLMAEALNKKAVVHDVFAKYTVHPGLRGKKFFFGTYVASVQFVQSPADKFPDTEIRETFPGFINIRGLQYQIYYVGRIDHCTKCRSFATVPHLGRDCDKRACWSCGKVGHSKTECPDRDTEMHEPGENDQENGSSGNPSKRRRI